MIRERVSQIVEGGEYVYLADRPPGCKGCRYRVVRFVLAVPAYQEQVLVEALEGPHEGLWFVCSPWNFSTRYRPVPTLEANLAPDPVPEEKAAGYVSPKDRSGA